MLEIKNNGWSVKQLKKMKENKTLRFDHPLQRGSDLWKAIQKSYLIHSAGGNIPIPHVYAVSHLEQVEGTDEVKPVRYIIDGKQRLNTLFSFIDEQWMLHDETPEVNIERDEFEVAGLPFTSLPEDVQDNILSRTITVYTIDGSLATEEEIEDLMYRLNNGVAMTQQQQAKTKMGIEWAKKFAELGSHPLITEFASFSKTQITGEKHITAIIQSMMMIDKTFEYKNVSEKIIAGYGMSFKSDQDNKEYLFERVKEGMDYLFKVIEEKENVLLKKVHFPMLVLTAVEAIDQKYTVYDFRNWMSKFKEEFAKKEEVPVDVVSLKTNYVEYTGKGTTDRHKADGRLKEMKRHMAAYMTVYQDKDSTEDDGMYGM